MADDPWPWAMRGWYGSMDPKQRLTGITSRDDARVTGKRSRTAGPLVTLILHHRLGTLFLVAHMEPVDRRCNAFPTFQLVGPHHREMLTLSPTHRTRTAQPAIHVGIQTPNPVLDLCVPPTATWTIPSYLCQTGTVSVARSFRAAKAHICNSLFPTDTGTLLLPIGSSSGGPAQPPSPSRIEMPGHTVLPLDRNWTTINPCLAAWAFTPTRVGCNHSYHLIVASIDWPALSSYEPRGIIHWQELSTGKTIHSIVLRGF